LAQHKVLPWKTTADGTAQLKAGTPLAWKKSKTAEPAIVIDHAKTYQKMDGLGHALTGGTAQLMMKMSARTVVVVA